MNLWDKRNQLVGSFSKGMKQKMAIARALIHEPKILFLDEPTANLDPESSKVVRDFILELKKDGKTIFLNTHNLDEAQRICDRIGIMRTKLLTVSTPAELKKSMWGNKTEIQLEKISNHVIDAVKKLNPLNLSVEGNKIILDLKNPLKENPSFVKAIVLAGGNVESVNQVSHGLEETYLKLMEETK